MSMKISFHSATFHDRSIRTIIKELKETGYDAIELNAETFSWAQPHIRPDMDLNEIKSIKQSLKDYEMDVSSISAHISLLHSNREKQMEAVEFTKKCILIAEKLNVSIVHGLSGEKPDSMSEEKAWEILSNSMNEIVGFSKKHNVKFAFESIAFMFINNSKRLRKLQNMITTGKLYVNMDTSNVMVSGESLKEFIEEFKKEIIHVHVKEGKGNKDSYEFPPLGEGTVNFIQMIEALKKVGYEGYLSVEYVANVFGYKEDIDVVRESSFEFINKLLGKEDLSIE